MSNHLQMRNKITIILLMVATVAMASVRTEEQAIRVACRTIVPSQDATMRQMPAMNNMRVVYTEPMTAKAMSAEIDASAVAVYVVQQGEDEGFVLVSGDDRVSEVLGYAHTGRFDAEQMPTGLQLMMRRYAEWVGYAVSHNQPLRVAQISGKVVAPLLGSTQWGQDSPYNDQCPLDSDGQRSVTGCAATAVAQVMYYWRYPEHGYGSQSYQWRRQDGSKQTLSADFASTYYDWANMLPKYKSSASAESRAAVAELMLHVGIAQKMDYSSVASGASPDAMEEILPRYFGYEDCLQSYIMDYIGDEAFSHLVQEEMEAERPVLLSGYTENWEGHAFVCDGSDGNGKFHINWGWTGICDGYYAMTGLAPTDQGIGGSVTDDPFSVWVTAITHIVPKDYDPAMRADVQMTHARISRQDDTFVLSMSSDKLFSERSSAWYQTHIEMELQPRYAGSIVGTYATKGTMQYHMGEYRINDGMVTLLENGDGYTIEFSINVSDNHSYCGIAMLGQDSVDVVEVVDGREYPYMLVNNHYTAIASSTALSMGKKLERGETSQMRYVVQGLVAKVPSYNDGHISLTLGGSSTSSQMAATDMYWLNNEPCPEGLTVSKGDTVVVCAAILRPSGLGNATLTSGYVCEYRGQYQPEGWQRVEDGTTETVVYDLLGRVVKTDALPSGAYIRREGARARVFLNIFSR